MFSVRRAEHRESVQKIFAIAYRLSIVIEVESDNRCETLGLVEYIRSPSTVLE